MSVPSQRVTRTSARPAAPPAVPAATPAQQLELAKQEVYLREREQVERRRQIRALLLLVFVVLALSVMRAGVDRVFPHRWWHPW